ncbi:MAG: FAD-dependent oxidoreductase [Cyclobacteriaceae bacterium]|nr:FAD-dependent oxidoreductase [Cyclobacteriaceae bacterium]
MAGSCLALRVLEEGKRIVVFDEPDQNRSSSIAAGLFNPITGKLMTRTWMADQIFPELFKFYQFAEEKLKTKFFYPQPLYRPFLSAEEQNEWMGLSSNTTIKPYIEKILTTSAHGDQVYDPFGGIVLNQCGFLDVNGFLAGIQNYLQDKQSIKFEHFDDGLMEVDTEGIVYKNYRAAKIIFCNGIGSLNSSRFEKLPIRLLKGETLTIELEEVPELIYNRGVYLVPLANNRYRVGATYETKNLARGTTEMGRIELDQKLKALIKIPYQVVSQDWGFRPTTPDRRPILGEYPESKNVIIFNGLGTKGVSLAPYFSAQLVNWLLGRGEIQSEVNIKRFKSLSSKSREVV